MLGVKPVVANHLNIPKPEAGQPTLLTYDEVRTAFHEFGHALARDVFQSQYPRFSGTNVPRDFVEYPSQVNEMWMTWPEILQSYAKHYKTGEADAKELLDKVKDAEKFDQGFKTTEYLAAALLDQAWHQMKPAEVPNDALAFEAAALKKPVDFAPVPPRYRTPTSHFSPAVTRPVITATSGARCSMPTVSSGSRKTAASNVKTATTSATRFFFAAAARTP